MLKKLELEKLTANNKKRFIEMQLNDELTLHKREIIDINRDLHRHRFTTDAALKKMHDDLEANVKSIINDDDAEIDNVEEEQEREKEKENEFAYLLDMTIRSFTNKKIKALADSVKKLETEIAVLTRKNEKDLWLEDLAELETAYVKFEKEWEKSHQPTDKKNQRKKRVVKKNAVKKDKENNDNDKDKKKDDKNKGPKPKKLPGFDDDASDTSSVKGKGKDKIKVNQEKKDKDLDKSNLPKKERKPRVKKDENDKTNNNADQIKTRKVKKTMIDVVDDDSFSMSDVVSEDESFVVNKKKKVDQDEDD